MWYEWKDVPFVSLVINRLLSGFEILLIRWTSCLESIVYIKEQEKNYPIIFATLPKELWVHNTLLASMFLIL